MFAKQKVHSYNKDATPTANRMTELLGTSGTVQSIVSALPVPH